MLRMVILSSKREMVKLVMNMVKNFLIGMIEYIIIELELIL